MEFSGPLSPAGLSRVTSSDNLLANPERLEALKRTGLMGTGHDAAFDRLATLAAKILKVPLTIVSLVSDEKQFFKAGYGLPAPYDTIREIPVDDSICRYTLHNIPIIAGNAVEDEFLKFHPTIKSWGIVAFIAIPMVTHDGQVLGAFCAVDDKVRPWSDEDVMVMRELTNSVMTEIQLRTQINDLQDERLLRERFVAALSHDLRNPLNVAKMAAQLMTDADTTDEERIKFAGMISSNVDRADAMIQNLLDASLAKAGIKLAVELLDSDLIEIVGSAVDALRSVYGKRIMYEHNGAVQASCDVNGLRRILENLVGNAVKYGDETAPITVSVTASADEARVSVHNLGPVIPMANLEKIFNLFERTDAGTATTQQGWGIGLAVAWALADEMNGKLTVQSRASEGTTFTVSLPMVNSGTSS